MSETLHLPITGLAGVVFAGQEPSTATLVAGLAPGAVLLDVTQADGTSAGVWLDVAMVEKLIGNAAKMQSALLEAAP